MRTKVTHSLIEDRIISTLSPFRVHPTAGQIAKIQEYIRLLLKWNQSVSLTSVVDPVEILARHFGESMFICCLMPVEKCRLADIGPGAGFPGLAVKIACPEIHLTLIESNKKKCAFLSEVVRALDLENAEVMPIRFEDARVAPDFAEVVTVRAVGGFPDILRWAKTALARRGHIILWLGGEDSTRVSSMPGWIWKPAVKIPESQRRFILIGRPRPEGNL